MEICRIPKKDKFQTLASSHRSKQICGKIAEILCQIPILVQNNEEKQVQFMSAKLCLNHSVELAFNKMLDKLPKIVWTTPELIFLLENGCWSHDLIFSPLFPNTLSLSDAELQIKTDKVKGKIIEQCRIMRHHPNFVKTQSAIKDRLELLEMFAAPEVK